MRVGDKGNTYADALHGLFDRIPKSVFAALAVSYALRQQADDFTKVPNEIIAEWETLYQNGIVAQRPVKL